MCLLALKHLVSLQARTRPSVQAELDLHTTAVAVYGQYAGRTKFDKSVKHDTFGNVDGPEYDLSPDGTFAGQDIAVLRWGHLLEYRNET